jgi:hypothetical protein
MLKINFLSKKINECSIRVSHCEELKGSGMRAYFCPEQPKQVKNMPSYPLVLAGYIDDIV